MTTQAELAVELAALTDQVTKVGDETRTLITKIADLTAALEMAGRVSPEVDAAVVALKAQVKVVDDLVPDPEAEPSDEE